MKNKLEARSTKAMFIGYSTTQKGYKCYDPEARRVLVSRDVKFIDVRGYYEETNKKDLRDLTSDEAGVLRIILEGLGIKILRIRTMVVEANKRALLHLLELIKHLTLIIKGEASLKLKKMVKMEPA